MKTTEYIFVFVMIVLITYIVLHAAAGGSMNNRSAEWGFVLLKAADRIKADPDTAERAIQAFAPHYASCSRSSPPTIKEECISTAEAAVKRNRKHDTLPSRLEEEARLVRKLMASVASTQEETNR